MHSGRPTAKELPEKGTPMFSIATLCAKTYFHCADEVIKIDWDEISGDRRRLNHSFPRPTIIRVSASGTDDVVFTFLLD